MESRAVAEVSSSLQNSNIANITIYGYEYDFWEEFAYKINTLQSNS